MCKPAGGVQNDRVGRIFPGPGLGPLGDVHRVHVVGGREDRAFDLFGQPGQLLDGRRAVHVRRHQQGAAARALKVQGQLGAGGGLARSLKADHHDHPGRPAGKVQLGLGTAHQGRQLLVDDLDHLLAGGQAVHDLLAHRAFADALHEVLDNLIVDVGLQQGHAHFAEAFLDVGLREFSAPAKLAERLVQLVGKIVKHPSFLLSAPKRALKANSEFTRSSCVCQEKY
jgi:hypothetical protein